MSRIISNEQFPQLDRIRNSEYLLEVMQQHLGGQLNKNGYRFKSCRVKGLRIKKRACLLELSVKVCNADGEILGKQHYFGKLFPLSKTIQKYMTPSSQEFVQPIFGEASGYIPEWNLFVWAYPNDPSLPGIASLMDEQKMLKLISERPRDFGIPNGSQPQSVKTSLLKHMTNRRCTYVHEVTLQDSQGTNRLHKVFGKTYRENKSAEGYTIMEKIWQSEACQNKTFRMPEPYWHEPSQGNVWQEMLPGESLAKIFSTVDLAVLAQDIGRGLAAFHGCGVTLDEELTAEFQFDDLQKCYATINKTFPEYSDQYTGIYNKLMATYPTLQPVAQTPVHGSFKFGHVLYDGKDIGFIDFDGANIGDPCYDLGRFIAYIKKQQADNKVSDREAQRVVENFCGAYNGTSTAKLPQKRIDWFATSHIFTSELYGTVKKMRPDLVAGLLKLADEICPEV